MKRFLTGTLMLAMVACCCIFSFQTATTVNPSYACVTNADCGPAGGATPICCGGICHRLGYITCNNPTKPDLCCLTAAGEVNQCCGDKCCIGDNRCCAADPANPTCVSKNLAQNCPGAKKCCLPGNCCVNVCCAGNQRCCGASGGCVTETLTQECLTAHKCCLPGKCCSAVCCSSSESCCPDGITCRANLNNCPMPMPMPRPIEAFPNEL